MNGLQSVKWLRWSAFFANTFSFNPTEVWPIVRLMGFCSKQVQLGSRLQRCTSSRTRVLHIIFGNCSIDCHSAQFCPNVVRITLLDRKMLMSFLKTWMFYTLRFELPVNRIEVGTVLPKQFIRKSIQFIWFEQESTWSQTVGAMEIESIRNVSKSTNERV